VLGEDLIGQRRFAVFTDHRTRSLEALRRSPAAIEIRRAEVCPAEHHHRGGCRVIDRCQPIARESCAHEQARGGTEGSEQTPKGIHLEPRGKADTHELDLVEDP
jgi:hypothetical protein